MKTAIVTFADGDKITTSINGTDEQILEYYKTGKIFNIGIVEDNLQAVVSCEILNLEI